MNYLLYGAERFLLNQQLKKIIHANVPEDQRDLNVLTFDCKETPLATILEDASTIPFLSDQKVVVIKNPYFLTSENVKLPFENNLDDLIQYLNNPNQFTTLIIYHNHTLDERKKIVKILKEKCEVFVFNQLDEAQLKKATYNAVRRREAMIDNDAMELLLMRVPSDISIIANEIDKLTLYTKNITKEDVDKIVTKPREDNVFELVSAILSKDMKKSLSVYKDLIFLNEEPVKLIILIANQIRLLYQLKILDRKGYNNSEIASKLGINPYRLKYIRQDSDRFDLSDLLRHLDQLSKIDIGIKNGTMDKKLGLEMFILSM